MLTNIKDTTKLSFFSQKRNVDIAIISAMQEELNYIRDHLKNCQIKRIRKGEFEFDVYDYRNTQILLAHTGIGTSFTSSALTLIHNNFHPQYIFLSGTAGGIHSDLSINDVVVINEVFEAEMLDLIDSVKNTPFASCLNHPFKNQEIPRIYKADQELLSLAKELINNESQIRIGRAVTSNAFPAPLALFKKIKDANVYTIDMETSAFYQTAWLLNAKVLAIRGVSNLINKEGMDDHIHLADVDGSTKATAEFLTKLVDKLIMKKFHAQENLRELNPNLQKIINRLKLQPHPEGGFYAQTYASTDQIISTDENRYNNESRCAGTSIYYLLNENDFSTWHKLKSDEIWHYYSGSPVILYSINDKGEFKKQILGPISVPDADYQVVMKAGTWFAAENSDKSNYSLVGCTVSPGFDFKDFQMAKRQDLLEAYPMYSDIISRFIREEPVIDNSSKLSHCK